MTDPSIKDPTVTDATRRQRFVVIVERAGPIPHRAFGPYQTFLRASADAKAWDGFVLPIEKPEDANV